MTRLIRAELYKLATTPGPWVLAALTAVFTAAVIAVRVINSDPFTFSIVAHARQLDGAGHAPAILLAPMVGVLCITSEYRHKVLTTTLLASPSRKAVLVAKAVASVLWGAGLCIVSFVVVFAVGFPWTVSRSVSLHTLTAELGPVVPGVFGVFALLALFGLGVGTLLKNQVAGVLVVLGLPLIIEPILVALFHQLGYNIDWLPSQAAAAVAAQLGGGPFGGGGMFGQILAWWQGTLALVAWSVGTAWLGYFTTFRRDVT